MKKRARSGVLRTAVRKASYGAGFAYGTAVSAKRAVGRFMGKRSTRRAAGFTAGGAASLGGGYLYGRGIMKILRAPTPMGVVGGFAQTVAGGALAQKGAGLWHKARLMKGGSGSYGGRGAYTGRGRGWRKFAKGKKRG